MLAYDSVFCGQSAYSRPFRHPFRHLQYYALYTPELTLLVQDPIILLDRDYASSCVVSSAKIGSTSTTSGVGLSV